VTAAPLVGRLRAADERLYRRIMRLRRPELDAIFAGLSRAADYSLLWIGIGAVMASLGGQPGRRAALRGMVSLVVASGLANGPLKLISHRARPARQRWVRGRFRRPRSSSFPSAHTSSGFAFATAVGAEMPGLRVPLGLLAGAVGYSRVHNRVHYPGDVLAGAALGVLIGSSIGTIRTPSLAHRSTALRGGESDGGGTDVREVVLVTSPNAGRAAKLERGRAALAAQRLRVRQELDVGQVSRLADAIAGHGDGPMVVAAGGDGTVGAVADQLANTGIVLGILPLGTSNDFARSLGIPMRIEDAARLLREGKVSTVDLGRLDVPGEAPRHFVHAATVGLNVSFAKLATQASLRHRLGRLTYVVAAAVALRRRRSFGCTITCEGSRERSRLVQLAVINAPVFGGFLGLKVRGSDPDDRRLDVLAVEELPPHRLIQAGLYQLFPIARPISGVRALHVPEMKVDCDEPLEVALDGEVAARLPADFFVAGEALRVVTPLAFEAVDDEPPRP
jgi:YegS/Rv2252/BmrU family lipid kinase